MKKNIRVIIIVVAILFIASIGKNIVAKTVVSSGVKAITGLKLKMKDMSVGIFRTAIGITGLRLFNPSGFEDTLMADMPEIYVDYDLGAFLKGKVHLETVRLNLQEFTVVKNKAGELNLDSLKAVKAKKEKRPKDKGKMPALQIDVLELKIGKVVYKDYTGGGKPRIRDFNVGINERYKNITDPHEFANLIVLKALMNTSISGLVNFDLDLLAQGLDSTLGTATGIVEGAAGTALKTGAKVTGAAKETTEKAVDAVKGILPFGKK